MNLKAVILAVTALVISVYSKKCTPTADELVEVLHTEVDSYDQFIYNRYLKTELDTCQRVTTGMSKLRDSFNQEIYVALTAAPHQFQAIEKLVKGTDVEPCINQMGNFLERDLNEEKIRFQQCLDVPAAQLGGLKLELLGDMEKYSRLKARTKAAVRSCLINTPFTCPNTSTKCMDTQIDSFNTIAKSYTESRLYSSPCMGKFVKAVQCFSKGVDNFVRKANILQEKMVACISLEDNRSIRQSILAFAKALTVNTTLLEQVKSSQRKFQSLNSGVVKTLGRYYNLEKSARMMYKFSSHDEEHFKQLLNVVFAEKFSTVEEVRRSMRHVWSKHIANDCCDKALTYIHSAIDKAALCFNKCEEEILNDTLKHFQQVRNELGIITNDLSDMGDNSIMDCLNSGVMLAENAIEGCYDLRLRKFLLDQQDGLEKLDELMTVLERYNRTYFNVSESTNSLCGNSFLNKVVWLVDKIIFQLNRCPYEMVFRDEKTISNDNS